MPGVVERGVYALADFFSQEELVIVGVGEALTSSEEVGCVKVAEVGVCNRGFVKEDRLGALDDDAFPCDVAVIVVGRDLAGGAAVDVQAAVLCFDSVDRSEVKVEPAHIEGPSTRGSLMGILLRAFVGVDGDLLCRCCLGELAIKALFVAATHEVRVSPVEVFTAGAVKGDAVAARFVELELAIEDAALLRLIVLMSVVGIEGAAVSQREIHLIQIYPAREGRLNASLHRSRRRGQRGAGGCGGCLFGDRRTSDEEAAGQRKNG